MSSMMDIIKAKRSQIAAQTGRGGDIKKPRDGKNRIRVLPAWRTGTGQVEPFWHDFGQHWIKDTSGAVKAVVGCKEKSYGHACEMCDFLAEKSREIADDDLLKALGEAKAKGTIIVNVLILDGDASEKEAPSIYQLTPTTFDQVLAVMDEYGDITDPKEGTDLVIEKSGKGLNTEYKVMAAAKSQPVPAAALGRLHNLDDFVKAEMTSKEQKAKQQLGAIFGSSRMLAASGSFAGPGLLTPPTTTRPEPEITPAERPASTAAETARSTAVEIDDDIPERIYETKASEPEIVVTPAAAATAIGADEDIEKMLADLDL
ncbi:hypothetical protein [Inquilinus sp. OTU3971]|uniref:hypothetical protein n=1 Tax=Inquilinus sp. OTU3971 TaxID=3043855 RepID=UPI00313B7124